MTVGRLCSAALCAAGIASGDARAAGAAYQVDTAEISEVGSCKVEAWYSSSRERDAIAAVNPACVADLWQPVEIGAQFNRVRVDGEYTSAVTPKLKTNLVPTAIGKLGVAVAAGFTSVAGEGSVAAVFANIPATLRLSHNARINLNAGWLRDRVAGADHAIYGAGVDVRTSDNVWTLTAEMFGQAVRPAPPGEDQPRYQLGVRYRPVEAFNVDLIYGRNLLGEGRDWLTVSTIVRFP